MIIRLIWRNIWRNRHRTLITMSSVTFAVVLAIGMKSLQDGIFGHLVKSLVSYYSGYIQVHELGYQEEQNLDNSMSHPEALLLEISKRADVSAAAARIEVYTLAVAGQLTQGCMLAGVMPGSEKLLTGLQDKVIKGSYLLDNDKSLMVAEGLARKLRVHVNDTVILMGQGYQGNSAAGMYPVKALVHFGAPLLNESLLFLPMSEAQNFLRAPGRVTTLAVNIRDPETLEATSAAVKKCAGDSLEVITWKEMMPDIDKHIRADAVNFYLFIGVLYLLIAFGMFGTLLMMLTERKYELGMLLAIGMSKFRLSIMLVAETLLITLLGGLAGSLLSYPVVRYLEAHPIRFSGDVAKAYEQFGFDPVWPAVFKPAIFLEQTLVVVGIGMLISLYPMIAVIKLEAVKAMKR